MSTGAGAGAGRRELAVFAALGALAVVAALLVPTYPNYDTYAHLAWGRELLHGHVPRVDVYAAPTQHPLWILISAGAVAVFGGAADRALVLGCVLALVALSWAVWRLGRACFGAWTGAVAVLFVGSSFGFLLYAARGYLDVPFLALVLWAGALEAERPRERPRLVMALLLVAGLLRPEAWLLALGLWLWVGPHRLDLLALALVAPVLWALSDLWLLGDPTASLTQTSALAEALGRERGIANVPRALVTNLADVARPPVFLAALLGVGLAWWQRGRLRSLHVPLALFGAGFLTFVGTGALGLSILPRYLTVPAVAVCLLGAWAVAGFTRLVAGRARTLWARGTAAAVVVGLAFFAVQLGSWGALARELRFIRTTHQQVVALAAAPAVERCRVVTLPTYRMIPDLRFELEAGAGRVRARSQIGADARGTAVFVVRPEKAVERFGRAAGVSDRFDVLPAGPSAPVGSWFRVVPRGC